MTVNIFGTLILVALVIKALRHLPNNIVLVQQICNHPSQPEPNNTCHILVTPNNNFKKKPLENLGKIAANLTVMLSINVIFN